jgi:hypothetical protein
MINQLLIYQLISNKSFYFVTGSVKFFFESEELAINCKIDTKKKK